MRARGEEVRIDDTPEVLSKRLATYRTLTEPLIHYYSERRKLLTVDGMMTIEHVTREIKRILSAIGAVEPKAAKSFGAGQKGRGSRQEGFQASGKGSPTPGKAVKTAPRGGKPASRGAKMAKKAARKNSREDDQKTATKAAKKVTKKRAKR